MAAKLWKITITARASIPAAEKLGTNTQTYQILAGTASSAIGRAIREYKPDFAGGVVDIEPSQEGLLSVSRPEPEE